MSEWLTVMFGAYPKFVKHLFEGFDHSKVGFSKAALFVMIVLKYRRKEKGLKMSELEHHAGLKKSTLSEAVDGLVKDGYVHRERSEEDRRVVKVKLTEKGMKKTDEITEKIKDYVNERLAFLSNAERKRLFKAFEEIENVAERLKESGK